MYATKQQAINHYLENINGNLGNLNKVEDVVWVNADKMMAVLKEHALLKNAFDDIVETKLPPRIEADWDTNDTKEFDRLLYSILVKDKQPLH